MYIYLKNEKSVIQFMCITSLFHSMSPIIRYNY